VGLHRLRGVIPFVVAVFVVAFHAPATSQTPPGRSVQESLNRIAADLFSASPHPAEAIQELKTILAADPQLAEGHLLLGIAYRAQGSPELMSEAVAELRQAIALKPSLLMARLTLARVYMDLGRTERAREELQAALAESPGRPDFLSVLGEAERQLGNPRRSADLNRQALAADAGFVQARYYLGLALIDLRQHADAIRELEFVAKSGVNPAEASLGLGTAYLGAGRTDAAIKALRDSVAADPARPEAHIALARAYRTKGLLDAALQELKLATPTGPATVAAIYRSLEPDRHMEEGLVRLQQGQLEAAAESFQRVLALDAGHAAARRQLAEVRKRLRAKPPVKKPEDRS
jgi:protein O-GlcNAc transferase